MCQSWRLLLGVYIKNLQHAIDRLLKPTFFLYEAKASPKQLLYGITGEADDIGA